MIPYTQAEFRTEEEFVTYLAEISNLMLIGKDEVNRLKGKHLEFFVGCVLAFNMFRSLSSQTARDWLIKYMSAEKGFTDHSLIRYRSQLEEKGWLERDGQLFNIPPTFDFTLIPKTTGRVFTFSVTLAKQEENAVGSSTGEGT